MNMEFIIIAILIINLLILILIGYSNNKKTRSKSKNYGVFSSKLNNLEFELKQYIAKNIMLENRIDFLQVHLDRYVKWFDDSNIAFPKLDTKSFTKPTESIDSDLLNIVKGSKKSTIKPTKVYVDVIMHKYDLSRKQAYNKAYYELNKNKK